MEINFDRTYATLSLSYLASANFSNTSHRYKLVGGGSNAVYYCFRTRYKSEKRNGSGTRFIDELQRWRSPLRVLQEQSSLSLTRSLKLFITQMHNCSFGLIWPRQVQNVHMQDYIYASTTSSVPTQYGRYMYSSVAELMSGESWQRMAVWDLD